jgi:hypothetical protein
MDMSVFFAKYLCVYRRYINQIKLYLSHVLNTTGVDLAVKCLLTALKTVCVSICLFAFWSRAV